MLHSRTAVVESIKIVIPDINLPESITLLHKQPNCICYIFYLQLASVYSITVFHVKDIYCIFKFIKT